QVLTAAQLRRGTAAVAVGAEPAVLLLAAEDRVDPDLRLVDHPLVAEHVSAGAEALEPVRRLLPAVLAEAVGLEPGIALAREEAADRREPAVEARGLQLELLAQPAARLDAADRQRDERRDAQGLACRGVERAALVDRRALD